MVSGMLSLWTWEQERCKQEGWAGGYLNSGPHEVQRVGDEARGAAGQDGGHALHHSGRGPGGGHLLPEVLQSTVRGGEGGGGVLTWYKL